MLSVVLGLREFLLAGMLEQGIDHLYFNQCATIPGNVQLKRKKEAFWGKCPRATHETESENKQHA